MAEYDRNLLAGHSAHAQLLQPTPHVSATRFEDWFEAAWTEREQTVYVSDFGDMGPGIHPLDGEVFQRLGCRAMDPRWLTIGAFESPPNASRDNWVYVTSGLSNAWEDESPNPEGWSVLGMEFLIQCRVQSPWALALARNVAGYQLMRSAGQVADASPLDHWDRTGVGAPIDFAASALRSLFFTPSPQYGGQRRLSSGRFEYLQVVRMTAEEHRHGKEQARIRGAASRAARRGRVAGDRCGPRVGGVGDGAAEPQLRWSHEMFGETQGSA